MSDLHIAVSLPPGWTMRAANNGDAGGTVEIKDEHGRTAIPPMFNFQMDDQYARSRPPADQAG